MECLVKSTLVAHTRLHFSQLCFSARLRTAHGLVLRYLPFSRCNGLGNRVLASSAAASISSDTFKVLTDSAKQVEFHVYNTISRQKEKFQALVPGKVGMYVCGVTTYDYSHIGHARVYVAFDVLYRHLPISTRLVAKPVFSFKKKLLLI